MCIDNLRLGYIRAALLFVLLFFFYLPTIIPDTSLIFPTFSNLFIRPTPQKKTFPFIRTYPATPDLNVQTFLDEVLSLLTGSALGSRGPL